MATFISKSLRTLAALMVAVTLHASAFAAGSVSMQVEHLARQAMEEYNSAMETNDSAAFLKYFASNAKYESPVFRYSGRAELARHLEAEFKTFKARYQVNKMLVRDSSVAVVLTWEAADRTSGDTVSIDMVALFEVGSSGQFSSATYYFDSAKAKALVNLAK